MTSAAPLFEVPAIGSALPWGWPERNIVFHGVNKSGSLSMSDVLRTAYFAERRANQFFSTYHKVPVMVSEDKNAIIDIIHASVPNGSLFVSHYLYGAVDFARANAVLLTLFRHPLARIVSIHSWLKRHHPNIYPGPDGFPSLERFAEMSKGHAHSQIAQFSVGYALGWRDRYRTFTAPAMLEMALETLEKRIGWFGLAEYFEESVLAFASVCGLAAVPAWQKDNRNAERTLVADLSPGARAAIEHHYAEEFTFYERARALFLERVGKIHFGPVLESYRAACSSQYKENLAL